MTIFVLSKRQHLRHRKIIIVLLLITCTLACGGWVLHEFYVSLTDIRLNSDSEKFEISMRLFPDDLDRALKRTFGTTVHMGTELEIPEADTLLQRYLDLHFSLQVDDQPVVLHYLGKEPEANVLWCYLESEPVSNPGSIRVRNSLLTEEFEDQVNIVQVYLGEWNRSLLLSRDHVTDRLTPGE